MSATLHNRHSGCVSRATHEAALAEYRRDIARVNGEWADAEAHNKVLADENARLTAALENRRAERFIAAAAAVLFVAAMAVMIWLKGRP